MSVMDERYDKVFKIYALKLVVIDGRKIAEVARELDLVHQTFMDGFQNIERTRKIVLVETQSLMKRIRESV